MNSSFHKELNALTFLKIKAYLSNARWVEDGQVGQIASIWHLGGAENGEFEILLPIERSLRDYTARVKDLLFVLAEFEKREVEDVLRDISTYFDDRIKIRVVHDDVEEGSIPLRDGALLIEKTRELLTSVTLSTLSKKRCFSGSRPQEVSDFISNARLGQTEVGSYVINIIAPIIPEKKLFKKVSFSRLVMTTLAKSLAAVNKIVEDVTLSEDMSIVDRSVEYGVSANLCDALIGLSGEHKDRNFFISISFSKSEPLDLEGKIDYAFVARDIPCLERISEYLKDDNYVIEDIKIIGIVNRLNRSPDKDIGSVTITARVEDKERNISFDLPSESYLDAIHAHENKQGVECSGDVHITPRSAKLLNCHDFRVLEVEDRGLFDG